MLNLYSNFILKHK